MKRSLRAWLAAAGETWHAFGEYLPFRGRGTPKPIGCRADLARFLDTRASHVAQTALYGYLRTRAGMQYPRLFDDDAFAASINIAKWELWIACLSDLAVYAGGLLARRSGAPPAQVGALVREVTGSVLAATGVPPDAGPDFARHAACVDARLAACDWHAVGDDESAFTESPQALVDHAPIIRELMALDEAIVRNSVRFRWHQVRRDLRHHLDARTLLDDPCDPPADPLPEHDP